MASLEMGPGGTMGAWRRTGVEDGEVARALEARLRQQAVLADLGNFALHGATPADLMASAAWAVGEGLELELSEVLELTPDRGAFAVRGVFGQPVAVGEVVPAGTESQAGYTILTGEPVIVDDLATESRFTPPRTLVDAHVVSGVSVVIQGRGGPLGVLGAHSRTRREFTPEDVSFLNAVASLLGATIERARAEEARRRSEASFRALIEGAPDYVLIERHGSVVYVNPTLLAVLGRTRESIVGRRFADLVPEDDRKATEALLERLEHGPERLEPTDSRLLRADGSLAVIEWVAMRIDFEGEPAWVGMGRDVSERKRLQARMAMTDRLVSVGTLAAGVAHELNNPLTYVLGNLDVIDRQLSVLAEQAGPESASAKTAVDLRAAAAEALDGARRMRQIVADLRGISRPDERTDGVVELADVVRAAVNLTRTEVRRRAQIEVLVEAVPPVKGNAARLGQVLVNLLVNAAQAIPPGHADLEKVELRVRPADPGWVAIEVRDTGSGIDAEVLPRIFEPFFTTKPVGVGTGLGLWICHSVVTSAGGRIEVDTRVNQGSCFRVLLQAVPQAERATTSRDLVARPASPRRRVLVVDDEPLMGALIRRGLSRHEVVSVENAAAALSLLTAGEHFDVVVCDLVMPVMTGPELYAEIRRELPAVAPRVVVMSGLATDGLPPAMLPAGMPFVPKPFTLERMEMEMERVAAAADAAGLGQAAAAAPAR